MVARYVEKGIRKSLFVPLNCEAQGIFRRFVSVNFGQRMLKFIPCSNLFIQSLEKFGVGFSLAIHTSKSVGYFAGFSATTTVRVPSATSDMIEIL